MEDNNPPKDYYKILEVDYDATEEMIKLNYRMLALKWHPDKHNDDSMATSKFQEINEAYNVLMDPALRFEYDLTGIDEIHKCTLREYLARFKGMILAMDLASVTLHHNGTCLKFNIFSHCLSFLTCTKPIFTVT